jgi:hypothetical protein
MPAPFGGGVAAARRLSFYLSAQRSSRKRAWAPRHLISISIVPSGFVRSCASAPGED